jgi:F420-dependent oxidoreductase-like protein
MRLGITARGDTVDELIEFAGRAERDGFHTLWHSHLLLGDPLVPIAVTGRSTSSIELGTSVLQTYPCHPLLQANRASSAAAAMGRPGLVLGVGPSHEHIVRDVYGLDYTRPGQSTEEYMRILTGLLRGETVDVEGEEWTVHSANRVVRPPHPVPVLLAALSPRMLRIAGEQADGTILWVAPPAAIESHVAPRITAAAAAAGRPSPRIVAGLPVAVHDDADEARAAALDSAKGYSTVPNYRRILEVGGVSGAADAAVVGDARSVRAQLRRLLDAGATDVWAGPFPVGDDPAASLQRTYDVLAELAD